MSPIKEATEVQKDDPVDQNVEAVVSLHLSSERQVNRHQRLIELLTTNVGRPWLLYTCVIFASGWLILNTLGRQFGIAAWDPAPFPLLQTVMTLCALLVAIAVLVTQNRQAKVDRRQAQLDLQISLAIDQRAAKIISLLEELRRDSPNLRDRVDKEADLLQTALDPHEVVTVLENRLDEAGQETFRSAGDDTEKQGKSDRASDLERKI
jgi:uncharacterized membrane protein